MRRHVASLMGSAPKRQRCKGLLVATAAVQPPGPPAGLGGMFAAPGAPFIASQQRCASSSTTQTGNSSVSASAKPMEPLSDLVSGTMTEEEMRVAKRDREARQDPDANIEPDRGLPAWNTVADNEHEIIGFMKPGGVSAPGASGRLPCEVPGSEAEEQADAAAAPKPKKKALADVPSKREANKLREAAKRAPAADTNKESDAEYRKSIGGFTDSRDVWNRMSKSREKIIEELSTNTQQPTTEIEYLRLEKLLKEEDKYHWRIGQLGFDDEQMRNDYYALHVIALQLNKARWLAVDVQAQKGKQTTGANVRGMFWKESLHGIIDKGRMVEGQFVDSHPTLRPFADCVRRNRLTKAFLRGFVDSRLKNQPQPANMKQLFDYFDKSYGYFYNSQLEVLGIRRNDAAEHIMTHIGRANGLTQHCVLLWREYARRGTTMLPADICADNHVNLALLKNIPLATVDRPVRRALAEVMFHVRSEMDHVRALAPLVPTKMWPLLMEAFLPNYYINFLEKNDFDVTRWLVESHVMSPGLLWFTYKQMWRWSREKSIPDLVSDVAPVPLIPGWIQRQKAPRTPTEVPDELNKSAAANAQK